MSPEAQPDQPSLTARDLVLTLRDLPSPPEAYYALNRLLDQPRWDAREAASIIEREPALTARVLRVANSPYYCLTRRVADVGQALMSIGSRELRNLVLVTTVLKTFSQIPSQVLSHRQFWLRAMRVGINARLLAAHGPLRPQQGELFIAGLLHDIGSLLICLKLPEQARQALLFRPEGPAGTAFSIEREVLGSEEAAVGRELLRQWRLPRVLELAVGCHPVPERGEEFAAAAAAVQLAVRWAGAQEQNVPVEQCLPQSSPLWQLTSTSPAALTALADEAERQYQAALDIFEL